MSDKIQMIEEQARTFLLTAFMSMRPEDLESCLENLKCNGYIRKSVVEEAEEMYKNWQQCDHAENSDFKLICKLYKAIQELKAENERLKCLKP